MTEFYQRTDRTFSAGEAADATGVSQMLQRDWRRHGFLASGEVNKKVRFTISELCQLGIMKSMTESGLTPSRAHAIAGIIGLHAMFMLNLHPEANDIEGVTDRDAKIDLLRKWHTGEYGPMSRFVFIPSSLEDLGPESREKQGTVQFHNSLADLEAENDGAWFQGIIFDFVSFAASLTRKVGGALIRYDLSEDAK